MLMELQQLPSSVTVLIVYVKDDIMLYEIQRSLCKTVKFDVNYIVDVTQQTEWQRQQKETIYKPLLGDKWLLRVNIDDIAYDAVVRNLLRTGSASISILYTHKYQVYSKLTQLEKVRSNKMQIRCVYGAKLSSKDMYVRCREEFEGKANEIPSNVLNYVVQQYSRDCGKFFKLIDMVKSGYEVRNRTDVVNAVGLGAISVDKLLVDLLHTQVKTQRGAKIALKRWLQLLNDLMQVYSSVTIVNQLQQLLDDAYYLKLMQIEGKVVGNRCEIPENRMTIGVRRLLAYGNYFWESTTIPKILWLRTLLSEIDVSNAEMQLMQLLLQTLDMEEKCEN